MVEYKIAICDDIMEERTRIQNYCKNLGYTDLTLYSCGEDFLNSSEISTVNLVFLDIVMPNKDGNAAIEEIMKDDPDATIIIASSIGTQSQLKKAIEAGAKEFIQKPLDQQQVISTVNRFLEGR